MEKRRKMGENTIAKIDCKNVVLDFFAEIEFNKDTRVATESKRPEHKLHMKWMTDTGDLR